MTLQCDDVTVKTIYSRHLRSEKKTADTLYLAVFLQYLRKQSIDHFRYTKIHTWLSGLGEQDKRNVLFIFEPEF